MFICHMGPVPLSRLCESREMGTVETSRFERGGTEGGVCAYQHVRFWHVSFSSTILYFFSLKSLKKAICSYVIWDRSPHFATLRKS